MAKTEAGPSAGLLRRIKEKPPAVAATTLEEIRKYVDEVRQIDLEIGDLMARIEEKQKRRNVICGGGKERGLLTDLFERNGLKNQEFDRKGNYPPMKAEVSEWMTLNQPDEPEKKAKLHAWLRAEKLGPLIRNTITSEFDKGQDKLAREVSAFLKKKKIPHSVETKVNTTTLKAEIRRRMKAGKPLTPSELELVGATVGKTVKLSIIKEGQ